MTYGEWRALVEKDLGGVAFDKALVRTTLDGLVTQPLYVEGPALSVDGADAAFKVCVRADATTIAEELAGGAEALWLDAKDVAAAPANVLRVIDGDVDALPTGRFILASRTSDPVGRASRVATHEVGGVALMASSLAWHEQGATSVDELALVLQHGAAMLTALIEAGLAPEVAASQIALQTSVGRDTFAELCKLRALRLCWRKLLTAAGAPAAQPLIHAVCSSRTLTQRDPWVNMLRGTTQLFAAILGGADLVTPTPYDEALAQPSPLGRRTARNAALVLREESGLGRVVDAAGGSYYLDTLTDQIAREAWKRFQADSRRHAAPDGAKEGQKGDAESRIDASYQARRTAIRTRKEPILGVSEWANLDEDGAVNARQDRRDAAPFEALRDAKVHPNVALVTLGPAREHRARLGFAAAFFPIGGLRTHVGDPAVGEVACLCGSDERYASEAAFNARRLKAAGCGRVLLAGKPGALERELREAGVDDFVYVGCDAVSVLAPIVGGVL